MFASMLRHDVPAPSTGVVAAIALVSPNNLTGRPVELDCVPAAN